MLPGGKYLLLHPIVYRSPRYDKVVVVPPGYISDGATGAEDIVSISWFVHDILCASGTWDDRTPCSNWQASWVLHDILLSEGRWFRARSWFVATLIGRPVLGLWERLTAAFHTPR
jgi:hypothetical protein